jgi:hypothetical protein
MLGILWVYPLPSYRINPKNPQHKPLFVHILSENPLEIAFQESNVGNQHTKVTCQLISTDFKAINTINFPIIPPDLVV